MASVFSGAYLDQDMLQRQYRDSRQMRQTLGRFLDVGDVPLWLRSIGYHLPCQSLGTTFFKLLMLIVGNGRQILRPIFLPWLSTMDRQ